MMGTEEKIEQFIEAHGIKGSPYEDNHSSPYTKLYYPQHNRCYVVQLSCQNNHETFYCHTGPGIGEMSLESALWSLITSSDGDSGYLETYERWAQENEDYIHELGEETAKLLYQYSRDNYLKLMKVLGETLYSELVIIAN